MKNNSTHTSDFLCKLLRYEPSTGKLFWRERTAEVFRDGGHSAEHKCAWWNAQYAGAEAFTAKNGDGYFHGSIMSRPFLSHRVIWAMETGEWPVDQIDHIDHDRANNRMGNLREASNQKNSKNRCLSANNTSGFCGVSWNKRDARWIAYIKIPDARKKNLGSFTDKEDAIAARAAASVRYGYHENHGRLGA